LNAGIPRYGLFAHDEVHETELFILANTYFHLQNKFHCVSGLAASSYLSGSQLHRLLRGIGDNPNCIMGYEVNVIEGHQAVVHKNSFRYELLNIAYDMSLMMSIEEFSHLRIRAYLSANFDHGYVNDRNRIPEDAQLTNTYLYGY